MYVRLKLGKSHYTIVDKDMLPKLSKHRWYAHVRNDRLNKRVDVFANINGVHTRIGRYILDAPDNMEVDHINHDPLDNRICNLRLCNVQENMRNIKKRANNTTGYKGVFKQKHKNYYIAVISSKFLGSFKTSIDAARAYDLAAKELHGEFACLNFPEPDKNKIDDVNSLPIIYQNAIDENIKPNKTSGYYGVSRNNTTNKWRVYGPLKCGRKFIGEYYNKEKAAIVYDEYIINNCPDQYKLNFPNIDLRPSIDINSPELHNPLIVTNTSGYRGVRFRKEYNDWYVLTRIPSSTDLKIDKRKTKFGIKSKIYAALVYDEMVDQYHIKKIFNFPHYTESCNIDPSIINDIHIIPVQT